MICISNTKKIIAIVVGILAFIMVIGFVIAVFKVLPSGEGGSAWEEMKDNVNLFDYIFGSKKEACADGLNIICVDEGFEAVSVCF